MLGCQSNKVVLFNNLEDIRIDDLSEREYYILLWFDELTKMWTMIPWLSREIFANKFDNHLIGKDSLQKST